MKGMQVMVVVFLGMFIGFMSCGYGGGPVGGGSPECRDYCEKTEGCCEYYPDCPPVDEMDMAECLCTCANMYRTATTGLMQGMQACVDIPCENYSQREACLENLLAGCASDLIPAVDALCSRMEECGRDVSYDECVYYYSQVVGCYSVKTQAAMFSCSSSGTCETFSAAFEQCMNTQLGLIECYPEDY